MRSESAATNKRDGQRASTAHTQPAKPASDPAQRRYPAHQQRRVVADDVEAHQRRRQPAVPPLQLDAHRALHARLGLQQRAAVVDR